MFPGFRIDLLLTATDYDTCYEVVANRYCDVRRLYRVHRKRVFENRVAETRVMLAVFAAGVSVGALLMLTVTGGVYLG